MIVSFSIRCFFATVLCTVVLHPLPAQERSALESRIQRIQDGDGCGPLRLAQAIGW